MYLNFKYDQNLNLCNVISLYFLAGIFTIKADTKYDKNNRINYVDINAKRILTMSMKQLISTIYLWMIITIIK